MYTSICCLGNFKLQMGQTMASGSDAGFELSTSGFNELLPYK